MINLKQHQLTSLVKLMMIKMTMNLMIKKKFQWKVTKRNNIAMHIHKKISHKMYKIKENNKILKKRITILPQNRLKHHNSF